MSRSSSILLPASLAPILLLSGCMGGISVDQEGISQVQRIAVVSVALSRSGASGSEKNRAVLQEGAERALAKVSAGLKSVRPWSVLDPSSLRGNSAILSLAAPRDAELAALLPPGDRDRVKEQLASARTAGRESLLGVKGMAAIPRSSLVGPERGRDPAALVRTVLAAQAGRLCIELQADAVAFLEIAAAVSHPRQNAFIVKDGRTDGQLRMSQTMVIIDRSGSVVADLGLPDSAERAAAEDYLPLYLGSGRNAVKEENVDLADPLGKVRKAVLSAIDASTDNMIKALAGAARK